MNTLASFVVYALFSVAIVILLISLFTEWSIYEFTFLIIYILVLGGLLFHKQRQG